MNGRRRAFGHACVRREPDGRNDETLGVRVDGHDGVAGVNGTAEPVRAQDGEHVADLPDAEQRRNTREQILAERRRRAEHVAEARGQARELRRENGGERRRVVLCVDEHDFRDAGEARGLRGDGAAVMREHGDDERLGPQIERATHALRRRGIEPRAVVLRDYEHAAHESAPRASSTATSSATSLTRTPAARAGGAVKPCTANCRCGSTPSSASRYTASGLLLALRISGSFT